MDDELRAAFARSEQRMNRWFELMQAQHLEFKNHVDEEFATVRGDVSRVSANISALSTEFTRFHDWATSQVADTRRLLGQLTRRIEAL